MLTIYAFGRLAAVLALAVGLVALAVASPPATRPAPAVPPPRLLVISSDGLRPDALSPHRTPNISAMITDGASACICLNVMPSVTMTNHATILTGVPAEEHHVMLDVELPGVIQTPTLLDMGAAHGRRCAFLGSKTKMKYFARPSVCEFIATDGSSGRTVERLLSLLTQDGPDVLFVHLSEPDSTGHKFGWMSAEYMEAVGRVDELLGQIRARLFEDAERPTYLVLTADHGGKGTNHFLDIPEDRQIPWIVVGPDIRPNYLVGETVSTLDTLPTVLWLGGLPKPENLPGKVRREIRRGAAASNDAPTKDDLRRPPAAPTDRGT